MSKHRSLDVRELLRSIHGASEDDLYTQHGIHLNDDGSVYDHFDGVEYDSIEQWAESQSAQQTEKTHHHADWG